MTAKILLVEDDARILSFIKRGLETEGYAVHGERDGEHGLERAIAGGFDLIILDRILPHIDGLEICRQLRAAESQSVILMLTAKDGTQDKVDGLKNGADDYMTKPFAFDEFLARVEALLRRRNGPVSPGPIIIGDLKIDTVKKSAWRGERALQLTAKEFALLTYLMRNAGAVVSRTQLLNAVWGLSFDPGTKVVDVYIRYLRRKVDEGEPRQMIQTVRGFGYVLSAGEA
jgi:DNA-binding response OmpR family regulator